MQVLKTDGNLTFDILVDDDVYEWAKQYKWYYCGNPKCKYVLRKLKRKNIYLHREVVKAQIGFVVDHKNHNTLDNQRNNLRLATKSQNNANKTSEYNSNSKYLGVSKTTKYKKYITKNGIPKEYIHDYFEVSIQSNKKRIYVGVFKDEIQAALAYNEVALKYHGEFANLNKINITTNN